MTTRNGVGAKSLTTEAAPTNVRRSRSKALGIVPGSDAGDHTVEALVAVTGNADDGGDILAPGGFKMDRWPVVLWNHNWDVIVAKVLDVKELMPGDPALPADLRDKGYGALWVRMEFDPEDPESDNKYRKVLFHEAIGWSIGWVPLKNPRNAGNGSRVIPEWTIFEASAVPQGMNREARTMLVKAAVATVDTRPPAEVADAAREYRGDAPDDVAEALKPVALRDELDETALLALAALDNLPEVLAEWVAEAAAAVQEAVTKADDEAEKADDTDDDIASDDDLTDAAEGTDADVVVGMAEQAIEAKAIDLRDLLVKRGRVLSARNEGVLREAMNAISAVLKTIGTDASADDSKDDEKPPKDDEKKGGKKAASVEQTRDRLAGAIATVFRPNIAEGGYEEYEACVEDYGPDWVVWKHEATLYRAPYTETGDEVKIGEGDPEEVIPQTGYVPAPKDAHLGIQNTPPGTVTLDEVTTMRLLNDNAKSFAQ